MKRLLAIRFLGSVVLTPLLCGAPLGTYIFSGKASGSVGSQIFSGATLSVTGTADTQNIEQGFLPFKEIDFSPGAAVLTISGVGSATFSGLVFIVDNYGNGLLLLGGLFSPLGASDIIELTDADLGSSIFATYFLNTSIGPIGPAPDRAIASWQGISTSLGTVSLTSYTDVTFQAIVVPEPTSYILVVSGLLSLVALLHRRKLRPLNFPGTKRSSPWLSNDQSFPLRLSKRILTLFRDDHEVENLDDSRIDAHRRESCPFAPFRPNNHSVCVNWPSLNPAANKSESQIYLAISSLAIHLGRNHHVHGSEQLIPLSKQRLTRFSVPLRLKPQKLELWRQDYNRERPHSALADRTPDEFTRRLEGRPFGAAF